MDEEKICPHCQMPIAIRNPSGFCDHLHYPENCEICQKIEQEEVDARFEVEQEAEQDRLRGEAQAEAESREQEEQTREEELAFKEGWSLGPDGEPK